MRETDYGRRAFLGRVATALAAFLGAAVGVPLVGAALAPGTRREESRWIRLGPLTDLPIGQPRLITFGVTKTDGYLQTTLPRAVWVSRPDPDQTIVYNARCTHLGCLLNFRPDSQTLFCPCHGGVFAFADGRVMDGPPPRPLDRLAYRIEAGQLLVQYQDFLAGVAYQAPL